MAPNLINADRLLQCNNVDCRVPPPVPPAPAIPKQAQSIDYMAKDYDSFLRAMLDLIPSRIPGWQTRTEADLAMAILELFAYVADGLSYYQDRVANEGFLATAVEYDSVRRLLSLIDYKLDHGAAARVFLLADTTAAKLVQQGFSVSTKATDKHPAIVFEVSDDTIIYPQLNTNLMKLKTNVTALTTQALLDGKFDTLLAPGEWVRLVADAGSELAQLQAPITFDPLQNATTITFQNPVAGNYPAATTQVFSNVIRLKTDVASQATQAVLNGEFDTFLAPGEWIRLVGNTGAEWGQLKSPISVNTVQHTTTVTFQQPLVGSYPAATAQVLGNVLVATNGQSVEQTETGTGLANQQIELDFAPLTYVQTASGQVQSSLRVEVGGVTWDLVEDFIDSGPTDPHYAVRRDNRGFITVSFGSGQQGRVPRTSEAIVVRYRYGIGEDGLVAAGTIIQFSDPDQLITSISNLEPSFGARNPEDLATAKLVGPRTLRHQNRAVTADDYANALLQGVEEDRQTFTPLHAKARFVWTGSWNTVIVSVDFADRQPLDTVPGRKQALGDALNAKRLAGYDVTVEDARYAPLQIGMVLHVKPDFFVKQVRQAVEQALGPAGFFSPSHFGFGDPVRLSDLYAVVLGVSGVQYITMSHFKRLGDRYPDETAQGVIDIGPLEIARCDNDLSHPENGVLFLRTCGGREGQ